MFAVERWNGRVDGDDAAGRRDGSRTPQFATYLAPSLRPRQRGRLHGVLGWNGKSGKYAWHFGSVKLSIYVFIL
jgi:hypothetical protein